MFRSQNYSFVIPEEVYSTAKKLKDAGFEAYLIGGCVRDLFLNKKPKDWDITTDAGPEEIIRQFSNTFYENKFGTVGVVQEKDNIDESLKVIEITPYRIEAGYSDNRRPDNVIFSKKLEDDLKRRDFTINAIAYDPFKGQIIDLYKGQEDINNKVIRTVGKPEDRFSEDALRMLRAIRISTELDFKIEQNTENAINTFKNSLKNISKERIRDEFIKIIQSDNPLKGLEILRRLDVLIYISPELKESIGIQQGGIHKFDVWEHLIRSLQHAADKKWALEIRLAALFHDIGKPSTRRSLGNNEWSFYGHEVIGARMAKKILSNLKFPQKTIEKVTKLIRWHMFFSDTETITHSAVRRLITNVGKDNVWDLMNLRMCDRIGTGRPKENPYRLRKYKAMIEEVMRDPIDVSMLKIDGRKIMDVTKLKPGPKIGYILHALLEEVLEYPKLNTEEYLQNKACELSKFSDEELKQKGIEAKIKKDEEDEKEVEQIRKRYFVE